MPRAACGGHGEGGPDRAGWGRRSPRTWCSPAKAPSPAPTSPPSRRCRPPAPRRRGPPTFRCVGSWAPSASKNRRPPLPNAIAAVPPRGVDRRVAARHEVRAAHAGLDPPPRLDLVGRAAARGATTDHGVAVPQTWWTYRTRRPGSRSNTDVPGPQPENSTRFWLGMRSIEVGAWRITHSARDSETLGAERPRRSTRAARDRTAGRAPTRSRSSGRTTRRRTRTRRTP